MKIIWVDGTFGVGKTAVANEIAKRMNNAHQIEFDELQKEYQPKYLSDYFGERYPEAKKYLIDALRDKILEMKQGKAYDYIIVPIALINDYCNQKLVNAFKDIEDYHFILTASNEIINQRIENQANRDVDLALTYMQPAVFYLKNHYSDAVRIDTSDMSIVEVAEKIIEVVSFISSS